jgi:NADH:ubiquinone oxidoreductase subunit C
MQEELTNTANLNQDSLFYLINSRQDLKVTAAFLKMHSLTRATNAVDITVIDRINSELRFNINYQFLSTTINTRFVLSTHISESTSLVSLQTIYPAFN